MQISKDDVLSQSPHTLFGPAILQNHQCLLRRYIESAQSIHTVILQALSNQLGLSPERSLLNLHRISKPSGDQIRITYAPPSSGTQSEERMKLGEHTDFGSLSLLFNRLGGLQVLPPGQVAWHYVRPMKGHAIVNLGDAMVKFTNGLLRSNIHRVVSPPGLQASLPRVSIVYFMRPEDDAKLNRLEGSDLIPELAKGQVEEIVNAKDWLQRRFNMRMKGFFNPETWDETLGTEVKAS
jgi:isopenicillin N synthase-like dioxygenase